MLEQIELPSALYRRLTGWRLPKRFRRRDSVFLQFYKRPALQRLQKHFQFKNYRFPMQTGNNIAWFRYGKFGDNNEV